MQRRIKRWVDVTEKAIEGTDPAQVYFAVANSFRVDLENEVVAPDGADLSYVRSFPTLYWQHRYTDHYPVGRVINWTRDGATKNWLAAFTFSYDPDAQRVKRLVDEGTVRGTSIGFCRIAASPPTDEEVARYGEDVELVTRKWLMLELSITPMPCNPDAIIDLGIGARAVRRRVVQVKPKRVVVVGGR